MLPAPTPPRRSGARLLLQPGWLSIIVLAIIFAALCFSVLAPWQFGRNEERQMQNSQIRAAGAAAPVDALTVLSIGTEPSTEAIWRTVSATGTFRESGQVQVRLRQEEGVAANEVLVPFDLTTGEVLLVDRGYITQIQLQAGETPPALPREQITISGRVQQDQPDPANRAPQLTGNQLSYTGIDPAQILPNEPNVLSGFIQLTETSPGVMSPIGMPQIEDGPFLSYALQWITFGAIALLAIGFFAYREVAESGPDDESASDAAGNDPGSGADVGPAAKLKFSKSDLYD